MSTQVFPSLAGLGWSFHRSPQWKTRTQVSVSGKETRIADWSFPRWQWDLTYTLLRQGIVAGVSQTELAQLAGFFNSRQGGFDSFLYADIDDNAVTGQGIGTGDASTKAFQLVRTFGGFVEPIYAPHTVSAVYLDGVAQSGGSYSISTWGAISPGILTFTAAPGAGKVITADFSFYFPVRFVDDTLDFEGFMAARYSLSKISLLSIK